jgi:hypothetical protein
VVDGLALFGSINYEAQTGAAFPHSMMIKRSAFTM